MLNYNLFLEEDREPIFYNMGDTNISIYIDEFIKSFKENFKFGCWFLYATRLTVSLQYYESTDDSEEKISEIRKFMFDKAPYFKDLVIHRDDHRIVLKFIDIGDPMKFKFHY